MYVNTYDFIGQIICLACCPIRKNFETIDSHKNLFGVTGFSKILASYGVFFSTKKNVHFISKNAISPSERVICFILNNLHFSKVEGIACYALYKSRVLIIPSKADDLCFFIGLPDEI